MKPSWLFSNNLFTTCIILTLYVSFLTGISNKAVGLTRLSALFEGYAFLFLKNIKN